MTSRPVRCTLAPAPELPHSRAADERARDDETPSSYGVSHGAEVPFVFDRGDWIGDNSSFTPPEERLATRIGSMWASFAARQPPLASAWPAYENATERRVVLSTRGVETERHPRAQFCDFWDAQEYDGVTSV